MVVFPHGEVPRAAVIPVGDPSPAACETVAETLRETFEMPAPVRAPLEKPPEDDSTDGNVGSFFDALEAEAEGLDIAIGVTDSYITMRNGQFGLFGVGLEFESLGIVSTARLLDGGSLTDLERERLGKETLSVVGTTVGLRTHFHADDDGQPCAVEHGAGLDGFDAAPATYCDECWTALTDESTAPGPDEWVVQPPGTKIERKWWDPLLLPLGLVFLAVIKFVELTRPVADRIPRPGPGWARALPEPVHEIYRIAKFWTNVVLYLGAIVGWLLIGLSVADRILGGELSDAAAVLLLAVGAILGVITVWIVKGICAGLWVVASEAWA
ncbi:peptidase zinc-dependent [Natrinema sp. H-ect1]|uniref:peptidase zinc-dependent n=1 Tax=Natrinema sp. H-ect1 TaxID=3242700 RepID=UPI00359EB2E5